RTSAIRGGPLDDGPAKMAATNRCLTQRNKPCARAEATKKRRQRRSAGYSWPIQEVLRWPPVPTRYIGVECIMRNSLISVVVADDPPVVLPGLVNLLRSCSDFKVVAECRDGRAAVKAIEQFAPSVAVLDMAMPGLNGLEVLLAIAAFGSKTRIVFLTALATENQILTAMGRGAKGVLHKDVAADELTKCIREVAQGREWLSESMAELIARVSKQAPPSANGNSLSMREKEVTHLASSGLSNKEIGRRLNLSEGT